MRNDGFRICNEAGVCGYLLHHRPLFASQDHHQAARQFLAAGGWRMFVMREIIFAVLAGGRYTVLPGPR